MRAARAAAASQACPATSTCTSPPICSAAVTAERVAPLICPLSCSTITRMAAMSDHLRFRLEFCHQRGDIGHLPPAGAGLGLADREQPRARREIHAQCRSRDDFERLLLCLYDVWQRD